jgi:hypothetical protein
MMPSSRSAAGLLSSSALPSVVVQALGCGEPLPLTGESNKEPIACGRPRRVRNGRPDGPDLMGGTVRGRSQGCHRGLLVGPGDVKPTTSEATICPKRAGTFRWGAGRLVSSGEAERSGVVPGRRRAGRRAGGRGRDRSHRRGAGAAAGTDGLEAAQLPGVSGNRRQAGAAVQLQPLEELGDRLGERDRGCGRLGHATMSVSPLKQ